MNSKNGEIFSVKMKVLKNAESAKITVTFVENLESRFTNVNPNLSASIIPVINEDKLSNDLLYQSPNYPILNVTDDETCLNLGDNSIVIKDACNLAALLEYFGYKKDLTFEDIMKIRKTFFTGRFAKDNCQLFGWKETMAEDVTFYTNGVEVNNPKELEKFYNSKATHLIRIKRNTDKYSKLNINSKNIPEFIDFEELLKSNYIDKIGEHYYE